MARILVADVLAHAPTFAGQTSAKAPTTFRPMRSWFFQAIRGLALPIAAASATFAVAPASAGGEHGHAAARPADAVPRRRLGLAEAIRLGASEGPGVATAKAPRSGIAEAERAGGSLFPLLPRATLAVGERRGPSGAGVEVSVGVLQDFSLGGLGAARRETATALARLTEADVARARLDAAGRAALAWIAVVEADRLFALRREGLAQADALLRVVRARVTTGVSDPLDLALAEGEMGAARASALDAEGMRFEAGMELAFATGQAPGTPIEAEAEAEGGLGDPGAIGLENEGEAGIARAAGAHPMVHVAEARREVAEREGRLAAAILSPTLGLGASFVREGTGDRVWSGIVSIPLPFAHPGAFDAARGRAAEAAARAHADATRAEVEQALRLAEHDREHMREVHDALTAGALTPMREGVRLVSAQLTAGTTDVTHVLVARQRLRTVEEQVTRALAEVWRADLRWRRARGTLLPAVTP
jgi:cobalt-zinc-cadmium efflux system outer membrane protein